MQDRPAEGEQVPEPPNEQPSGAHTDTILPYRPGREDLPSRRQRINDAISGAILAALVVFGLVAVWVMANLNLPPNTPRPPFEWRTPAVITLIVLGLITAIAVSVRSRFNKRAFALGALIGIGVAVLIEGACFASTFR